MSNIKGRLNKKGTIKTKEQPNYYAIIPANVRYDKNLKDKAKLLYGEITSLSNKDGFCYASNKYFAELYQVELETISRLISSLENNGYIERNILYKKGTKEIEKRILIPIDKKNNTYCQKNQEGYCEFNQEGIDQKVKENNTSINNTSNNIYSYSSLYEIVETNFGRTLNPIEYEKISEWEDNELTRYAIKCSVLNNKYSINYIDRILSNWSKKNIKTVAQAQEDTKEFNKNKYQKTSSNNYERRYKTSSERIQEVFDRFMAEDDE